MPGFTLHDFTPEEVAEEVAYAVAQVPGATILPYPTNATEFILEIPGNNPDESPGGNPQYKITVQFLDNLT
jgi:hypothetical protein